MPRTLPPSSRMQPRRSRSLAATSRPHERSAMKPRVNLVRLFALGMAGLTWAGISDAAALDYPTRPVRWVVGYPAGGTTDILARLIGQYLSEKLGQQFIVENKPGAGNNIGTEAVIHSPPDGYTVLLANPATGIKPSLYQKLSFRFTLDIL